MAGQLEHGGVLGKAGAKQRTGGVGPEERPQPIACSLRWELGQGLPE